ncbi:hypothetical protein QZH41_013314, partial [Actinostola sp. cb2023]
TKCKLGKERGLALVYERQQRWRPQCRICCWKMGKSDVEKTKVVAKSRREKSHFPTKVVIRRLPPSLTEEKLKECLGDLPESDFFYFVGGKLSFDPVLFSRAYINFTNPDDIIKFRDEFDGFVFTDDRGQQYPAVVEYAPYQGIPKKKNRKDPKCNTIEQDKDYVSFLESLQQEVEPLPSMETHLEEIEARKDKNGGKKSTPLLEYLKMKRSNRGGSRLGTGKKRQEKDETPKTLKKNVSSTKDSKSQAQREEKNKSTYSTTKRMDNRDTARRDQGRKEDEKKQSRDKKDSPLDKDTKPQRNQKERERDGKNRPDSARPNSRTDDRRHGNRRDRQDSERRDHVDTPKGRDERGRRFNDRYSDDRRRDNPPNENRSSGNKASQSSGRGKERDETARKQESEKDHGAGRGTTEKREHERERERREKREAEREKELNRVKNKDRPDRAIYQPRSRNARPDSADQSGKAEAKVSPENDKDREKEKRENKDRDFRDKNRERNRDRDRDRRGDRGRDKDRDKGRDRERYREQDKRERDRERDRVRKKDRDRRDKEPDFASKEQKNEIHEGGV